MSLAQGTRLGKYEIVASIGAGAMGEVYRAKDVLLGRDVAIKVLPESLNADADRLRRFEQEARTASSLNHPNIVTVYEVGRHEGAPYIAMEYIDGVTLRDLLAGGPIPHDKLVRYISELAEGIAKAHEADVIHRDLKPENVLVREDGLLKIVDFGLAKLAPGGDVREELETLAKGTAPGVILGTVGYMSPEQARGEPAGFRSDQFALGAIAYEMATGRRAFEGDSIPETLTAIIREDPEPITITHPEVPGHVASVIDRCLEKDPNDRFPSTWQIAKAMHEEVLRSPPEQAERHPLANVWAVGALAVLVIMILALLVPELREWVVGVPERERIESLAVLPLANLSGDPEQAYFVDGMTEALIARLAKIDDLRVISRTSVMAFRGERASLSEIAEQLGVDSVVEGSVLRAGDEVRINAQLIDTRTDEHLWGESYQRDLADVLGLQDEVSRAIAGEVRRTLSPSADVAVSPEAYDEYLRGRYFFNLRELPEAIAHFQEAIRLEPEFAAAYVALARAYLPRRQIVLARAAVEKAIPLDPLLHEAGIPLATVLFFEWRWEEAEAKFREALELNPNDAELHHVFSFALSRLGRHDEAIALQRRALALDPLSPIIKTDLGSRLLGAERADEALAAYGLATRMAPAFGYAHVRKALALFEEGRYEEALTSARRAEEVGSPLIPPEILIGMIYARTGRGAEARDIARGLMNNPLVAAPILGALGDLDAGFELLEQQGFRENNPDLHAIAHHPMYRPFRDDPRTADLLRRMNFPGY